VRDEVALDQQTMEICLREIDRCQQTGIIGRIHISILDAAEIDAFQGNGLSHPALDRRALSGIEGQTGCPSRNRSNSMTRSRMRPSAINSCGVLPAKASSGVPSQCLSSGATT